MTPLRWIAFVILIIIAAAYGYLTVQWQQTEADVQRITRVVEGTPGEKGEPGQPGVGITDVIVRQLPTGSAPYAVRRSGGLLTLYLPRGAEGPAGPRGRAGADGRNGKTVRGPRGFPGRSGKAGRSVNQNMVAALVNSFLRSHTFTCTKTGRLWTCRISGGRR
jgi:hypothetical protein